MQRIFLPLLLLLTTLAACNSTPERPNTDKEVARTFIRNILDNNFKNAQSLLLSDKENQEYFDLFKKDYSHKSADELEKYKNADIVINEIKPLNDSVTIIDFSNTYKRNATNKLKVMKQAGQWSIDLKYTFKGN